MGLLGGGACRRGVPGGHVVEGDAGAGGANSPLSAGRVEREGSHHLAVEGGFDLVRLEGEVQEVGTGGEEAGIEASAREGLVGFLMVEQGDIAGAECQHIVVFRGGAAKQQICLSLPDIRGVDTGVEMCRGCEALLVGESEGGSVLIGFREETSVGEGMDIDADLLPGEEFFGDDAPAQFRLQFGKMRAAELFQKESIHLLAYAVAVQGIGRLQEGAKLKAAGCIGGGGVIEYPDEGEGTRVSQDLFSSVVAAVGGLGLL